MTKASLLLLLLALAPLLPGPLIAPARAEPFIPGQALNQPMVASVAAASLAFMAPRTLEAIPLPQMAMWGLRGLTTLDPRLTPDLRLDERTHLPVLSLIGPSRVLLSRFAPNDAEGWGEAIGQMVRAAWDGSEPVRQAGTGGIIRTFFDELFNHFDPYSRYTPPAEAAADRIRRAGQAGVGVTLALRRGSFVVAEVQAGSPAAQAGVRAGDRLLEVDGQSVQGADLQAAAALLAGPADSDVSLTLRGRDGRVRSVDLVRVSLPPETVVATRRDEMLVLQVSGFSRNTAARIAQEIIRGLSQPPSPRAGASPPVAGIVLDLRGNRGGLLRQAVAAAAMVQPEGVV
ncbi:MAG TPA: PDZ domain-containing protein, partial [Acetobacteraceae bacterium]